MIEAFRGTDAQTMSHLFDQMFRQRYDVYVRERGWSELRASNGRERDRFDDDAALYLMAIDDTETVLGSLRLLPTTGPHLFAERFAALAGSSGVPRGPDIYELTRYCVSPACRSPRLQFWLAGVLACGMFEHCLESGIRKLSSVVDLFLLNNMLETGWRVRPLGLPSPYAEGTAVGVLIDVSAEALQSTRRKRHVPGRALRTPATPVPRIAVEATRRLPAVALRAH